MAARVGRVSESPEDVNAKLAANIAIQYLAKIEDEGIIPIERESVYGAAVAIPQVARSAGWPNTMIALSMRMYFYLVISIILQTFLLTMLSKVQHFMTGFSGQMHLCDFGAQIDKCPNSPNCRGPGGTNYTYSRLYDYDQWTTRLYVRDSLKAVFPDKADEINELVDPGEYGMESYSCRIASMFLFSLAVLDKLQHTVRLTKILYFLPSSAESWISYSCPSWGEKNYVKQVFGQCELHLVKFSVAGMPMKWKIFTGIFVLVPKVFLWLFFVAVGVQMVMETNTILQLILNSMALTFIPALDHVIFSTLTRGTAKHIMENIEDFSRINVEELEATCSQESMERFYEEELGTGWMKPYFKTLWMRRLFSVLIVLAIFAYRYYMLSCDRAEDGSYVATPLHAPTDTSFSLWDALFPHSMTRTEKAVWSMPD